LLEFNARNAQSRLAIEVWVKLLQKFLHTGAEITKCCHAFSARGSAKNV